MTRMALVACLAVLTFTDQRAAAAPTVVYFTSDPPPQAKRLTAADLRGGVIRLPSNASTVALDPSLFASEGTIEIHAPGDVRLSGRWFVAGEWMTIRASGAIEANGWQLVGAGARVTLDGRAVRLRNGSSIDVASGHGGEVILRGRGGEVEVDADSSVDASGLVGGRILLTAQDIRSRGRLRALGRGRIEVEAKRNFEFTSSADTGGGVIRLDPTNMRIGHFGGINTNVTVVGGDVSPSTGIGQLDVVQLTTLLGSNDVVVHTTNAAGPGTGLEAALTLDANDGDIVVEALVTWNSAFSLSLLAHDDLIIRAPVQNTGAGAVLGIAGWDGATLAGLDAADPTLASTTYGNGNGDAIVYGTAGTLPSAWEGSPFGSNGGLTTLRGRNVIVRGLDTAASAKAFAMVGFRVVTVGGGATGNIQVSAKGILDLRAGLVGDNWRFAQIGHGGAVVGDNITGLPFFGVNQGDLSGNVTVNAGGAITMLSGVNQSAPQIGHGGELFSSATRGNLSGNVTVTGASLLLDTGNQPAQGSNTYIMIGNGGACRIGRPIQGTSSGDITINVTGDLTMDPRSLSSVGGVQIGNGGHLNTNAQAGNGNTFATNVATMGAQSGSINVTVGGNLTMFGGQNGKVAGPPNSGSGHSLIGHGGVIHNMGAGGGATGSINVTVGGNATMQGGGGGSSICSTQIGHGGYVLSNPNGAAVNPQHGSRRQAVNGNVTVNVAGTLDMFGGLGQTAYSMIGNGGPVWAQTNASAVANAAELVSAAGNVGVTAGSIRLRGGQGTNVISSAQIGNGGVLVQIGAAPSGTATMGPLSGMVNVTTTAGDLSLLGGTDSDASNVALVGHGGFLANTVAGSVPTQNGASGNVTVLIDGESSLVDGASGARWNVGHLVDPFTSIANAAVRLDTATLDFAFPATSTNATINNANFWPRFADQNLNGGQVTLRVNGPNGNDGQIFNQQPISPTSANGLNVFASDDLTLSAAVTNNGTGFVDLIADDANPNPTALSASALFTIDGSGSIGGTGPTRLFAVSPSQFSNLSSYIPPAQKFGIWYNTFGTPVVGVNFKASPDVSIVKTLTTAGPYTAGQSITYTLDVANSGTTAATNIQVTDTPTNLTITNVSGSGCVALPCTIASLATSANTIITVTATITAAGAFDNSATAMPAEEDLNLTNNTDNAGNGDTAAAASDVSLVKTLVTAGPFVAGQSISYTLDVANAGPSTATNIQVTDTPTNLVITNVSGGGCAALPCTIASLASGANTIITVTATITAAGAFDNSATATATEFDPDSSNNTDNAGNGDTAAPSADVSLVKTLVTAGPFVAGQSISYTLDVANAGPSTATNIQVTDTPTNLAITNVSGSGCAALPCTIASLASGANTTITVTATIMAAGAFDNSATAAATEFDSDSSNNTDSIGNGGAAAASADVSLLKTLLTPGLFTAGQSISYTLDVANAGPSTATNIQVTDTPTNLTITNVSGSGCAALPCTIASLASGANTSITVTATITSPGAFDNSATATATEFDSNSANNTDNTGNGSATEIADVSLVKTLLTPGLFTAGQNISYTLDVANAGPSMATNIQVTDTPTNLTITNVSGSGCAALPCTIASLGSGANTSITVTATITSPGAFDNSATATATEFDSNSANNTDNTGNGSATEIADVSLVKTLLTSGPFTAGQSISYTLDVANAGPSTATNIQVTDTPTNLTITNVSGSGCVALPCTIASLASGANTLITVTATITSPGGFDNSATATATEFDSNSANNTDNTGNGSATEIADVSLVKTLLTSGPFTAGQSISYTLDVANAGPSTATNIQVTDTPTNLTITNVSGSGCAALPCTIASLASGANTLITVTATITSPGGFDNSATAMAAEFDSDAVSNTDNTGNGGNAAATSIASIPTTSEFGLVVLLLLLTATAASVLRIR